MEVTFPGGWVGWVRWLETDNRAISVQLNLTGTELGNFLFSCLKSVTTLFVLALPNMGGDEPFLGQPSKTREGVTPPKQN